jgi:hypothetical protein
LGRLETGGKGWRLAGAGSSSLTGEHGDLHCAGFSQGTGDMLGSREYRAFSSPLGFIEVVDRMDSSPEGKGAQNEDESA